MISSYFLYVQLFQGSQSTHVLQSAHPKIVLVLYMFIDGDHNVKLLAETCYLTYPG